MDLCVDLHVNFEEWRNWKFSERGGLNDMFNEILKYRLILIKIHS